jgi:hypothetical protein
VFHLTYTMMHGSTNLKKYIYNIILPCIFLLCDIPARFFTYLDVSGIS